MYERRVRRERKDTAVAAIMAYERHVARTEPEGGDGHGERA